MIPFFVQIKCHLGKSYAVASALKHNPNINVFPTGPLAPRPNSLTRLRSWINVPFTVRAHVRVELGAEPWLTWKKTNTWIWRRPAPTTRNRCHR